jgi:hypothetical protein
MPRSLEEMPVEARRGIAVVLTDIDDTLTVRGSLRARAGDNSNDSPMFGFFPKSAGVASVLDFKDDLQAAPAYVATARNADGFAGLADILIAARR